MADQLVALAYSPDSDICYTSSNVTGLNAHSVDAVSWDSSPRKRPRRPPHSRRDGDQQIVVMALLSIIRYSSACTRLPTKRLQFFFERFAIRKVFDSRKLPASDLGDQFVGQGRFRERMSTDGGKAGAVERNPDWPMLARRGALICCTYGYGTPFPCYHQDRP